MQTDISTSKQPILYEVDYLLWIETTVEKLRHQEYTHVDWANLIEEIEAMARRERRRLKSNLIVLLLYLLKWQYQPERRSGSWSGSIVEHRRRLREDLEDSPSSKPYLAEVLPDAYVDAIKQAAAETEQPSQLFPPECPYALAQVIDDEFLPPAKKS